MADRKPNGTEGQSDRDQDDATTFGTALATLFVGVFFAFCAFYLGPYPAPLGGIVKWGCLLLAAACFVFFVGFWGVAMGESPEMWTFFKAIWGGGERGWLYLGRTTIFVVAAFTIHFVVVAVLFYLSEHVDWLEWAKYVAWVVEWVVVVLALFASVTLSYALDDFFIRPILEKTVQGGEVLDTLIQTVRTRSAVVVPIVIALITLWVEITR